MKSRECSGCEREKKNCTIEYNSLALRRLVSVHVRRVTGKCSERIDAASGEVRATLSIDQPFDERKYLFGQVERHLDIAGTIKDTEDWVAALG